MQEEVQSDLVFQAVVDDVEFVEVVTRRGKQKRKAYKHNWKVLLMGVDFGSEDL
jgi:hypothetical protein